MEGGKEREKEERRMSWRRGEEGGGREGENQREGEEIGRG